jgi:DNA-directed RNA polymerase subunit K/omega
MIQLPENFDSIFRYIVVVSQRAEQLIKGAKPRTEGNHAKPTLVAMEDVDAGEVPWRILTQEELDAQRQAIVDEFRAEVGAEAVEEGRVQVPDVLPTRAAAEPSGAEPEDEERDDEIARLQRLLGIARGADSGQGEEEEESAEPDLEFSDEDYEGEGDDDSDDDSDDYDGDYDGDGDGDGDDED